MTLSLTIAGNNFLPQYVTQSAVISQTIENKSDLLKMTILQKSGQQAPNAGSSILFMDGSTILFQGFISKADPVETGKGQSISWAIEAMEYTYVLINKYAQKSYTSQTLGAIVADLLSTYVDSGYGITHVNVQAGPTIPFIAFNHISLRQCFAKLSKITGYIWWVDYNKDLHFVHDSTQIAPEKLTETSSNFYDIAIGQDLSQVRNQIVIIGATTNSGDVTESYAGDGVKRVFNISHPPYSVTSISLNGVPKAFAQDPGDSEAGNYFMYDPVHGYIRVTAANPVPATTDTVAIVYSYQTEVITKVSDPVSINTLKALQGGDGIHGYTITDTNILSLTEARARGVQELDLYSQPTINGQFMTRTGLLQAGSYFKPGQLVTLNLPTWGISTDTTYLIQTVDIQVQENGIDPVEYIYTVKFGGRAVDINQLLNTLAGENETIDNTSQIQAVEAFNEEITATDSVAISLVHNPVNESVAATDTLIVQALDYPTTFVAGDFKVTDIESFGPSDGSLIAQFKLNETSGATVIDSTGKTGNGNLRVNAQGYYPFNGNANDISYVSGDTPNARNGTVTGATLTTDRFGNANSAYRFVTGTMQKIIMPNTYDVTANNIFVHCVAKITMDTSGGRQLWRFVAGGSTDCFRLSIEQNTGYPFVWKVDSGGNGFVGIKPTVNVADGNWHTLDVTYNKTTGICVLYIDGTAYTGTDTNLARASTVFMLGDASTSSITGSIDECFINYILPSSSDILRLYNQGLTHKLNNPFVAGKINGGYELWGVAGSAANSGGVAINCGTGISDAIKNQAKWTISGWVYCSSAMGTYNTIGWYGGNYKGSQFNLASDRVIRATIGQGNTTGSNTNYDFSTAAVANLNDWNLITMVYDGTNIIVYCNGTVVWTYNIGAYIDNGSGGQTFKINANPWDYNEVGAAKYDDVRVYNRDLTATEVAQLLVTNKRQFVLDGSILG